MKTELFDKSIKIKPWDWMLLIGMTLAPMTSLRIWKVGPAEVMCLIWGLRFFNGRIKDSILSRFFTGFLSAMLIGTAIGVIFTPDETGPAGLLTWVYFAIISLNLFEGLSQNTLEYNEKILITFVRIASVCYTFLCLYGVYIGKTFFGLQLWYAGKRFTGGATNPHQVALLLSVLIILSLRDISKHGNLIVDILCIAGCTFALSKTISSTAIMATTVGVLIWANGIISRKKEHRLTIYIVECLLIALVLVLFYEKIFRLIYDWIASDPNGLSRFGIFKSYSVTFWKSPLFGLGPGVHAHNGVKEYHNTYIEVLAATGIVGFVVFTVFTVRLIKKAMQGDIMLLPSVAACYMFGMSGFGMRRLVYWIVMVYVITISDQRIKKDMLTQQREEASILGDANGLVS